jgi:CRP-like cAMP-binding protein
MANSLQTHITKFISLTDEDFHDLLSYCQTIKLKKKQNLLEAGKICRSNYFVLNGCLRMFFINNKAVEQTTHFALENWWVADYQSFSTQTASTFYIQAIESTEVLAIDYSSQEKMLAQFPQMERYFRLIHQRAHAASQFRVKGLYELSGEERYHQFIERYPEFVQRIPQYLLASFLGLTPEYLSEIRRKYIS